MKTHTLNHAHMMRYLLVSPAFCFLLFFSLQLQAQAIKTDNLRWSVSKFYNEEIAETSTNASVFESTPQKVTWIQKNGARVYEFEITGTDGSWPDVTGDGEFTCNILFRGNSGTIKFSRRQGVTTIETNIQVDGKNILPYTFTVIAISEL
jgi:hypothetical protein